MSIVPLPPPAMRMVDFRHPNYDFDALYWRKWRLAYEGGTEFKKHFLRKFSSREDEEDFECRKSLSFTPAFAKAAINDIKNAIYQRIADVTRTGGPKSYIDAVNGLGMGVDLHGSSMNAFIGRKIISELLVMRKVGVYIDRPALSNTTTKATNIGSPYLYPYQAEDILSWAYKSNGDPWEFQSVLLSENQIVVDEETLLPSEIKKVFRLMYLNDQGNVVVRFYDETNEPIKETVLKLTRIPFVVFEISESLMKDIADYQIALLNMESSDIAYILKANFPFYTEQYDARKYGSHLKNEDTTDVNENSQEVEVGATHGRRYPMNAERPGFIAPPTEPLQASMAKAAQLKNDIRQLVNLAVSSLQPTKSNISAEAKQMDERGLEAGLSCIGLELEHGERQIAKIWAAYENQDIDKITVCYPRKYNLKSDSDILKEVEALENRLGAIPSLTYKKEVAKEIVTTMLETKIDASTLQKIKDEIDSSTLILNDPDTVFNAVENAILSNKGAALALTIPVSEVEQAKQDHADRAARIANAQASASAANRGVNDLATGQDTAAEKTASQDPTLDPNATQTKTRGTA